MNALGCHIVAEFSACNPATLADLDMVQSSMVQAAKVANAEVREIAFHRFQPHGVSGVVVIAESHLSIHTWPELGYAAVDIYTCGDTTRPMDALNFLSSKFESESMITSTIERGIPKNRTFSHKVAEQEIEYTKEPKSSIEMPA